MSSITRRWLRGSLLVTLLLVAVAEGLFIYATWSGYYNGARQAILSRISITSQNRENPPSYRRLSRSCRRSQRR